MPSNADQQIWEREQAFMKEERKKRPELFVIDPAKMVNLMERIGVTAQPPGLPQGYMRYSPLDFLVEEIDGGGKVVEIAASPEDGMQIDPYTGTVWADLVKVMISTLDAVQRISDALRVGTDKVRYAGIKDAVAVTGQRISIRGVKLDSVKAANIPNVLLKNLYEGKGAMNIGDLKGNRFTLFVRTGPDFDQDIFRSHMAIIADEGVINYYGEQRFGSPRFLAHGGGLHLFRGDFEAAVKSYLTMPSPFEIPFIAEIRARAAAKYGDWAAMGREMERLPYSFRYEITMLRELLEPKGVDKWVSTLASVSQQSSLWAYAYASYLTNVLLSDWASRKVEPPAEVPLLLSQDPDVAQLYMQWLEADGTSGYAENLKKLPFIMFGKSPSIPAKVKANVLGAKVVPEGAVVSFELPKAAYATTILRNLFTIIGGLPLPPWLKKTEYDTKELLGSGSIADVRARFAKEIEEAVKQKGVDAAAE